MALEKTVGSGWGVERGLGGERQTCIGQREGMGDEEDWAGHKHRARRVWYLAKQTSGGGRA